MFVFNSDKNSGVLFIWTYLVDNFKQEGKIIKGTTITIYEMSWIKRCEQNHIVHTTKQKHL